MKQVSLLFFFLPVFLLAGCTVSAARSDNKEGKEEKVEKAAGGEVIVLNKSDFLTKVFNYEKNPDKWVYEGDKPCIIDFYADWCGPCRKVSPVLKELAAQYEGRIVIYKVDVDKEQELARAFGIQSIPTLLFIPKEGDPQMAQGALPKEELITQIDKFLLGKIL
ncbi:MAG: thioredoxin [Tannerellaceae bacterium]|nr:thioredoxin [Tannerellaceae bacterium]